MIGGFVVANSALLATALIYQSLGVPVVPFKITRKENGEYEKHPLSLWKKWLKKQQSEEELRGQPWEHANAIAVLLGTRAKNDLYLSAIDYDAKGAATEETKLRGKEILRDFPTSEMHETVNHGLHLIYWSRNKVRTDGSLHGTASLELLGEKKLCLVPPSFGYKRLNDYPPTEVDNLEETFCTILKKYGLHSTESVEPDMETDTLNFSLDKLIDFNHLNKIGPFEYQGSHPTHDSTTEKNFTVNTKSSTWHCFRHNSGGGALQLLAVKEGILKCEQAKKGALRGKKFKEVIQLAVSQGLVSQEILKQLGSGDLESNHYIQKPTIVTDAFIAEMVWDRQKPPYYITFDFASEEFNRKSEIDLGEFDGKGKKILYVPPFNDQLKKGLVVVPSDATSITFKDLFDEIDGFTLSSYDPCGQDGLVKMLTRIAVGSWFMDRFVADPKFDIAGSGKFAPLLPIRGPSQSGKNRLAFVLRLLSYRPYFEMSTYRIPSLYRPLDLWQGTLILDEADFANTTEKNELVHFLNCRATGTPISRQNPKNPKMTDTFSNFGLTILTQRRPFDDNATESRALPYYSETSDQHLPVIETDEMLKQGLELQNKLLYLRLRFYRQIVIDKQAWIDELSDHRLVASLLPLLALSKHEPSLREIITKTARQVERAKVEEKANSMDGLIVNYLWEKINERLFENWRPNIFYFLESRKMEDDGYEREKERKTALTTKHIADQFKWSPQSIRKALASLGIVQKGLSNSIKVERHAQRVIFFDPKRLEKRLREFVVNYVPNAVTQVTGVTVFRRSEQENPRLVQSEEEGNPLTESVTPVTSVTGSPSNVVENHELGWLKPKCGDCRKWHTSGCFFNGDPSCVAPTNIHAAICGDFDRG